MGGALVAAVLLIGGGIVFIPAIDRVPVELSPWARVVPVAFILSGALMILRLRRNRWRPPGMPIVVISVFVLTYFVVGLIGFPAFERVKPVKGLARSLAAIAGPDDHVGLYRMNRWSTSFRFYVERPTEKLEVPDQIRQFLATPGRHYIAVQRRDYDELVAQGFPLKVVYEKEGLFTTTGRGLRGGRRSGRAMFMVVVDP